jgi:metal transporter CNNM
MSLLLSLFLVFILVSLSAIYSGLNVALLSLNVSDLRRKAKLGNQYAKKLLPLRTRSHLTLAGILLCNVATISTNSVVLDRHINGALAVVASTLLMVVFGEVLPQAFFARNALVYCGRLEPLLRATTIITYPIARPLELLLDSLLGDETQVLLSRNELGILMSEHTEQDGSELDEDEVEIIRGALQLSEKQVRDIYTPIQKVYWLSPDSELTPDRIDEIKAKGYSRIPIFNPGLTVSYGVMLMKDLVDIDFDNELIRVSELHIYPSQIVGSMTALDTLFRRFINSGTHLLPVEKNDKIIGVVTIEDLLEEILQHEIEDETDRSRNRK